MTKKIKKKRRSEIKQISTKMSASRETDKASKDDKGKNAGTGTMQTNTPNKGQEGKETNTAKQKGNPETQENGTSATTHITQIF